MTDNVMILIILIVFNIFTVWTVYDIMESYFKKRDKYLNSKIAYFVFYILTIVSSPGMPYTSASLRMEIIVFSILIFLLSFLYKSELRQKIYVSFIIITLLEGIELLIQLTVEGMENYGSLTEGSFSLINMGSIAVARLVPFIIVKTFVMFKKSFDVRENTLFLVGNTQGALVFLLPTLSFVAMLIISSLATFNNLEYLQRVILSIVILIILILTLSYYYVLEKIAMKYRSIADNLILRREIKFYNAEYEKLQKSIRSINKIQHNQKYVLANILGKDNLDEIKEDIGKLIENQPQTTLFKYTGNNQLDTMLNLETTMAETQNVNVIILVNPDVEYFIKTDTLCVLLGNAIDNAIEAAAKVEDKRVTVRIEQKGKWLHINVTNSYNGEVIIKENQIYSLKDDRFAHGHGLQSINEIANENNGEMIINADDNIFKLDVKMENIKKN